MQFTTSTADLIHRGEYARTGRVVIKGWAAREYHARFSDMVRKMKGKRTMLHCNAGFHPYTCV